MPCKDYRPAIGETIFVSLSNNLPILITVTGFRYHSYLKEEVMEYARRDGSSTWSSYRGQTFFPEIPVDTRYLYVIVENIDNEYGWGSYREVDFFFSPEAAFDYFDAAKAGKLPVDQNAPSSLEDWIVEVQKVT